MARRVSSIVVSCALFGLLVGGIFLAFAGVAWGHVLALAAFGAAVAWEMTREAAGWRRAAELRRTPRRVATRRLEATSGPDVPPLLPRSHRASQARETPDQGTWLMWALLGLTSLGLLWIVLKLLL